MVEIIESREQRTPAWLSDTLAAAGIKATVTDVEIGTIVAGYFGSSSRLTLQYAQADDSLPRSLFLKMASEHESARDRAAHSGMYGFEDAAPFVQVDQIQGLNLAQGVSDFSLQECIDDYRRNLLYPIHVAVSVTQSIGVDAQGQQLFASMVNRACEATKIQGALELIESL